MLIGGNNIIIKGKKKKTASRKKSKLLYKYPDSLFVTDPSSVYVHTYAVISTYPGTEIDYDKAVYIDWWVAENPDGSKKDGLVVDSYGEFTKQIDGSASGLVVDSYGIFPVPQIFPDGTSSVFVGTYANIFTKATRQNWAKWTTIGSLNFTLGGDNLAGEMPLDWSGLAFGARKLANKVVVYGANGVSFITPSGKIMSLQTIYRTGVKGGNAFAGDDNIQFFVDVEGRLFQITDTLQKLDYSEYLASLSSNVVLSYDHDSMMLYICDGIYGYIYSPIDKSMGTCSPFITGIGVKSGELYTVASSPIITPVFETCTDIYNMGTHKNKTIWELEIGANVTGTLQAAIDYRDDFQNNFTTTSWVTVDDRGNAFITALGREFRIRAKSAPYEYFEIDYIYANGVIHDH